MCTTKTRTNMSMKKTNTKMDSHLCKDVHDENQKWIVIRTKMCMTKTHRNMDSHSYKDVNDRKPS